MAEVADHYNASSSTYSEQYDESKILTSKEYPANYFRLKRIKERVQALGLTSIYELGIGDGSPLAAMAELGLRVGGSDLTEGMLGVAKAQFEAKGFDSSVLTLGDIQDRSTLTEAIAAGPYDAVMALGVLPHVRDEGVVIDNMSAFIEPGGTLFLQFRNSMMSLWSFNRLTMEFIEEELLKDQPQEVKDVVRAGLEPRLAMDKPPKREWDVNGPAYDEILAKFHNPFELADLVREHGFTDVRFHWYNYHVTPPMMAGELGQSFRTAGIAMEDTDTWRGMFLCSSGVIEATKA
ncbi:MAG: methyltransferase domain-containing protein [Actinomycetales bacterium]|nr:methyltransferase domain-containing protein [Actinomycetales bacterium]